MLVKRVVLDTMYARGASETVLSALRARGLLLSISVGTLQEIWAHSVSHEKPGVLFARAQTLAKYLDRDMPVTPIGLHLKQRIHPLFQLSRAGRANVEAHRTELRALWEAVLNGSVAADWRAAGEAAEQEMAEDTWPSHMNETIGAHPELRTLEERHAVAALRRNFCANSPTRALAERCHAHMSVFSLRIIRSAKGNSNNLKKFTANDSQDTQLLMQVGLPAFLATADRRLLTDVDASGTYQSLWVRQIDDLTSAKLPECLPWGPGARRAARDFNRSSLEALRAP